MELPKGSTPIKNKSVHDNLLMNNAKAYKTPVKQKEYKCKQTAYQNNTACFTVLPNHITPPSGLTKFIARNPFESDLTNRLHLSVISPTVFNKVSSPQHSPEFSWSVEELALIQPAKIEEFPIEQMHYTDPETEIKAQAAIDKFFNAQQILPSPWNSKENENKISVETETPKRVTTDFNLNKNSFKAKKDGSAQTTLSLPFQLPPHVEEILQPYFNFTQEQATDNDDINCSSSSNSSLRRKLFFNHEEYTEEEQTSLFSPEKKDSLVIMSSPLQSGMLMHGTPLTKLSHKMQRYHGTPLQNTENLSPTNVSPIHNVSDKSRENIKAHSRSVAKLNFSCDLSIEMSTTENMEISQNYSATGVPLNIPTTETEKENINQYANLQNGFKDIMSNQTVEMESVTKHSGYLMENIKNVKSANNKEGRCNFINKAEILSDLCQTNKIENYTLQQTNTFLGTSERRSISGIVQDTGYETYCMNSTTNMTDNSPMKQKMYLSNRGLISDDEIRLFDWKGNLKNVVCSTPSKKKGKNNE